MPSSRGNRCRVTPRELRARAVGEREHGFPLEDGYPLVPALHEPLTGRRELSGRDDALDQHVLAAGEALAELATGKVCREREKVHRPTVSTLRGRDLARERVDGQRLAGGLLDELVPTHGEARGVKALDE